MSLPQAAAPVCFVLTADRTRSKPFYAEVLGLRLLGEDAHAATFDLGNRTPLRLTDMPGHRGTGHTVVGWNVADIVGTARALRAKGVTFTIYDGFGQDADGIWHSPDGGAKVAWFPDPDGNLLSLTQFG
ncbi:VOC family protein [Novosphingobium sp.]|jgi:catechol 2,3-dioxygenase-like lactoylglutathione lyase family enzyme|uniref:VOC family protein n=1 Tax=Novosphingobium sp. TaxID=1874826 RepID=UPI0022C1B130|nr:VOC family protein [Novosphingobium sp.]MCZ8019096.1 VOC family protein [Novosphingobium sp.]MCZ8034904.1 VOC family protein [Novosphingobium sp.]MCZ8052472.1 VOC family protein [Novosphingobium sp.]MCZ8058571.1 VOC family protein [Novosphingobium sp.]MCZ8232968.1 VOC family protein [Novosphingobium sp.]